MIDCISYFFDNGSLPGGMNSSFITLISKVDFPSEVKDSGP